jgi:two-component system chemotaxis response regulator CheB
MRPRVLIADDSSFMRRLLRQALAERGFDVVAEAADGDEALERFRELRPDVMTLDLAMPGRDGIGVLRELRRGGRTVPAVVVSAFSPAHGARAVDALAEGAFDLVAKPAIGEPFGTFADALGEKLRVCAAGQATSATRVPVAPRAARAAAMPADRVLLVATSTGGPRALAELIPMLPATVGSGGLIVQHMPPGFTHSLAERLGRSGRVGVREAADGDALDPTTLLLAPGGRHLRLHGDTVRLTEEPPVGALRPRADLMIRDAAERFGPRVLLVVMTGMGNDGLDGARHVRAHGGRIICEAEATCTVFGMPRAVVEAGLADEIVPLHDLAKAACA